MPWVPVVPVGGRGLTCSSDSTSTPSSGLGGGAVLAVSALYSLSRADAAGGSLLKSVRAGTRSIVARVCS